MPTTPKLQGPASYFPSIEKKYGQPIDYWMKVLAKAGDLKHMAIVMRMRALRPVTQSDPVASLPAMFAP